MALERRLKGFIYKQANLTYSVCYGLFSLLGIVFRTLLKLEETEGISSKGESLTYRRLLCLAPGMPWYWYYSDFANAVKFIFDKILARRLRSNLNAGQEKSDAEDVG